MDCSGILLLWFHYYSTLFIVLFLKQFDKTRKQTNTDRLAVKKATH